MSKFAHHFYSKISLLTYSIMAGMAMLLLISCGGESDSTAATDTTTSAENITLPPYTIVKQDVDGKDATYRIQVGDTLPNEQESIAIFRKVSGIADNKTSRNTAVYFTRAGFSAIADAHAYVMFTKSDEAPQYKLQTADNASMKAGEALTFDSIDNKKLVVEMMDAHGSKTIIYKMPSGEYKRVIIFGGGSYDISTMKGGPGNSAEKIVLIRKDDDETFTYKEDETGKMIEVYNANNSLFNAYKILKKG